MQFQLLPAFTHVLYEKRVTGMQPCSMLMGVPGSLLGKQSQSGNIRFTVGQYWLIIKINGANSLNFVGNSVKFVGVLGSLLGKQSQSGNIRFTVGQYWLIIKINGANSLNFVGNSVKFVGNMLSNRNFS